MDDPVLAQYEAYPYPARDPADEAKRLIIGSPSQLDEVNHYLFAGRRDLTQPLQALVAGGGTGDGAIMLAQQLADRGGLGQVVYLDLSAAARRIAEARAAARGLTNLTFLTGRLEDLAGLAPGPFDYIDCCGVIHHLDDPAAGLAALAARLAADGGIGLMVYGEYGRTGVYPTQAALRLLGRGLALSDQVALAQRLLAGLPATNWLRRNPFLGDHKRGDAELVDLFLHARDRAYSVPQLVDLAAQANLETVSFIEPARYDPAGLLDDPALSARLAGLSALERAALAEILAGNMKKHIVYLAPQGSATGRIARLAGPETVLRPARPDLARAIGTEGRLSARFDGLELSCPLPPRAGQILGLVDGKRTLGQIHGALQAHEPGFDWLAFVGVIEELVAALCPLNLLWLALPPNSR